MFECLVAVVMILIFLVAWFYCCKQFPGCSRWIPGKQLLKPKDKGDKL